MNYMDNEDPFPHNIMPDYGLDGIKVFFVFFGGGGDASLYSAARLNPPLPPDETCHIIYCHLWMKCTAD